MAIDPTPLLPSHDFDQISSLGKYKIQRKVGAGGMGAVYLAEDQQLKRSVALKVLPRDKASNKVLVRRFKAEGQAGASLEHPNIVHVYESGEIDGYLYLAMEFVEGIDAFDLLRKRGVLPVKRSLDIIKQVLQALEHAHERQIVHRDIKPSNLMIREQDGIVKLADMGLARIIEDDGESAITKAGTTVGTVDYMSPEQGKNSKAADIRSDIYSLGCTWFHLLAGKPPYPDGDLMNKLRAHALQPVPDPRIWNENIPAGIVAVIQRMMAKKPEDRYQTPAELLADLGNPALLRGDISAEHLQMLAAAHDELNVPDSGPIATSSPNSGGRSGRNRTKGKSQQDEIPIRSRGTRPAREEAEPQDTPAPKQTLSGKRRKVTGREALPERVARVDAVAAETDNGSGKRTKSERALPGRIDQPLLSEAPRTTIDPDQLKMGLLALIVLVAIGGIVFAMQKYAGGTASEPLPGANPYAVGDSVDVPVTVTTAPAPGQAPAPEPPTAHPVTDIGATAHVNSPQPSTVTPLAGSEDLDRTPFGGGIPFSADGTNAIPAWVWQSRVRSPGEKVSTIRRSQPATGEFRDLASALAAVRGGAVFEFADEGPHDIPALTLSQAVRLTLRGAEGVSPVLIVRDPKSPFSVTQGTLSLDRVHLILLSEQTGPGIQVGPGTLAVRHSTLTYLGPAAKEFIHVGALGRVLLEDTVIRSCGTCCPVALLGEKSSLVAGQSLLIAGNASAITVDSNGTAGDQRQLTLIASACLSGQSGLALHHAGKNSPAYEFRLQESVLAYLPGHSADAVGLRVEDWPQAPDTLDHPRVPHIQWTIEKSAWVGWPHWALLSFQGGESAIDVRDEVAWRTFWRQPSLTSMLIPVGADLRAVAAAGPLASCEQVQGGFSPIQSELGPAGPKWGDLPLLPRPILTHVVAADERPQIPASLESPDPGTTLRFDLKKPNLGKYLSSDECPDGSTVVAFGSGLRTIDPFVLRQKRVQVVFEQAEGTPLIIQPGYKTEPNAASPPAWIVVEDGQLTLSQGSLRMASSKTRTYPERFLQMQGGLVAIRHCRIEGIDAAWPLIDTLPSGGHAPPQLLIDQSLLVGTKSLVRVGTAESVIEVRRSILSSSQGVAVTLDAGSAGSQCSFIGSTMSAGKAVYQVFPGGAGGPSQLYSQGTIFQGGAILDLETDASAIQWWGFENAFASDMKTFLLTHGAAKPQNFVTDWQAGWGEGHELLPVIGANSTLMSTPPPNLADVTPESFRLHADCTAAMAGPTGQGVGAVIAGVGPDRTPVAAAQAPGKAPPKGTPPKGTLPANPGF